MSRPLEQITQAYWKVRMAVHHPEYPDMTTEEAFDLLRTSDLLRPSDWRLSAAMHEISFDIVEGNTQWRNQYDQPARSVGSILILPTSK